MFIVFENFQKWLRGSFTCTKCGRVFSVMHFGYGKTICPDCYDKGSQLLEFDNSYWLNRFLIKKTRQNKNHLENIIN